MENEEGFDMDLYLKEKFPEQEDSDLDYSNPMEAGAQFRALKESAAKKNIGVAETIRRLKSGRKFE
jgi:hypothetical protein